MRRRTIAMILAIVALAAIFFAPELSGRSVAMTANLARWRPWMATASEAERSAPSHNPDCATSYYPRRWLLHDAWQRHRLPLWNPWSFCGAPLLADPQTGVLYPPSWLLLPFDPGFQLGAFLFLHVAFGGVGVALLLRRRGVPRDLAALGGCAFALNGFFAKHFGQPPFLATAAWLPWVMMAALAVAERPSRRGAVGLALAGAGVFLAGQPQIALLAAYAALVVGAGAWITSAPASRAAVSRVAIGMAGAGALAGLLVAAQLLPTLELSHRSARAELPWATVASGAFHPVDALRFVCEEFFGSPLTGDEWAYLFPKGDGFYLRTQINSVFAGTPIFLLALYGMISRRTRRAAAPFTILFLVSTLIAFGSPLAALAYRVLPGFDFARLDRAGALVVLAQFVPAGLAAAALARGGGRGRRLAGAVVLVGALAAWGALTSVGADLPRVLGASPAALASGFDPALLARVPSRAVLSLVFAAVTGVAFLLPASRWAAWLPLGAAAVQLFVAGVPYRGDRAPDRVFPTSVAVEQLRAVLSGDDGTGGGRFLRFGRDQPVRPYAISSVLPPSTNVPYALRDLQGYNALADRRLGEMLERATGEPLFSWGIWSGRRIVEPVHAASLEHPLLDALAVRAVVGATLPPAAGWTPIPCTEFALARNDEARPRVSLSFAGHGVTADELAARVAASRIDPAHEVLWVGEGVLGGEAPPTDGTATSLELVEDSGATVRVRMRAPAEAMLVVADSFDPGWSATVDGTPARIVPAWGLVRGVRVPPGPHLVEMRYVPPGGRIGAGLSLLGLVVAGLVLALAAGREADRPAPSSAGTL